MAKSSGEKYSNSEARQRFQAALRGARLAGAKPMKSMARKQKKEKTKPGK
jgi:hypothetical protein